MGRQRSARTVIERSGPAGDRVSPGRRLGTLCPVTTNISDLISTASALAVPVVRNTKDEQLDDRTPCTEFSVRDLLNHLFQVVVNFQELAARKPVDFRTTPNYLDGAWRDRFEAETKLLIGAWSDPSALEGVSPGMGMPQEMVGQMVLLDLTVHAWDLAGATGQPFNADPAAVAALAPAAAVLAPQARKMGVFGEPVPVSVDAGEFDQLLGLIGRDPTWRR